MHAISLQLSGNGNMAREQRLIACAWSFMLNAEPCAVWFATPHGSFSIIKPTMTRPSLRRVDVFLEEGWQIGLRSRAPAPPVALKKEQ
jgi:hypothetical protein